MLASKRTRALSTAIYICASIVVAGTVSFTGCGIPELVHVPKVIALSNALESRLNTDPAVIKVCRATHRDRIYLKNDSGRHVVEYSSEPTFSGYIPPHQLAILLTRIQAASAAVQYPEYIFLKDAAKDRFTHRVSPRGQKASAFDPVYGRAIE